MGGILTLARRRRARVVRALKKSEVAKIITTQAIMYLSYCVFHAGSFTILKVMTAYKNINMHDLSGKKDTQV